MSAQHLALAAALVAVVLAGATFGFFYAWVCSTMWGLDAIGPRSAIEAMNGINAAVQNLVFLPSFALTPVALGLAAVLALAAGRHASAGLLGAAASLVVLGVVVVTFRVHLPLNDALAATGVPADPAEAARIWQDFSGRWQRWNLVRMATSGLALLLAALGLALLRTSGP